MFKVVIVVNNMNKSIMNQQSIVIGGGCFWCTEAVFQDLQGVISVESGYSGGTPENAHYRAVCSGMTKHAEVIKVNYDADVLPLEDILEVHFFTHNPTTFNQQGADRGPQYRSVIFYANEAEKSIAKKAIAEVAPTMWEDPIVTTLEPLERFYLAENYHQSYYNKMATRNPYCEVVITPKVAKFRAKYADRLQVRS